MLHVSTKKGDLIIVITTYESYIRGGSKNADRDLIPYVVSNKEAKDLDEIYFPYPRHTRRPTFLNHHKEIKWNDIEKKWGEIKKVKKVCLSFMLLRLFLHFFLCIISQKHLISSTRIYILKIPQKCQRKRQHFYILLPESSFFRMRLKYFHTNVRFHRGMKKIIRRPKLYLYEKEAKGSIRL